MTTKLAVKSGSIIHDVIEGEAVVMNLDTGLYFSFNPAATRIWALIVDGAHSAHQISQVAGSVNTAFLQFLHDQELITSEMVPEHADEEGPAVEPVLEEAQWHLFSDMKDLLLLDPVHDIALTEQGWPEFRNA